MRDTSGVTQCRGHKVCVCHLQLCQTGTQTGTEYLEKCYWDEQSGEKQTKLCTDTYCSLSAAWRGLWIRLMWNLKSQCHKMSFLIGQEPCSLSICYVPTVFDAITQSTGASFPSMVAIITSAWKLLCHLLFAAWFWRTGSYLLCFITENSITWSEIIQIFFTRKQRNDFADISVDLTCRGLGLGLGLS